MNEPRAYSTKWSQSNTNTVCYSIHMRSRNIVLMKLSARQECRHRQTEQWRETTGSTAWKREHYHVCKQAARESSLRDTDSSTLFCDNPGGLRCAGTGRGSAGGRYVYLGWRVMCGRGQHNTAEQLLFNNFIFFCIFQYCTIMIFGNY